MNAGPGFIADIADDDGDQITIEADELAVYLTVTPADEPGDEVAVALKAVHLDRFSRAMNEAMAHVKGAGEDA